MLVRKKLYIIVITASILTITYLHYSTISKIQDLHNLFTELYYLPLLLGALIFGFKGAIITYMSILVLYLPYIFLRGIDSSAFAANKLFHALVAGLFVLTAGYLVDREKKRREQLEKDRYLAGLGRATSAVVHDLKNPLITILGFASRIREGKGNIKTASQTVIDTARDMQLLVRDSLDFAKPVKLDLKEEDIGGIINKACNSCETKANEKGVALSVYLPVEQPVKILIDRSRIKRALINLINNAIEASKRGETAVVRAETGHDRFIIRIKDYGDGMDRTTVKNIFIPFYTKKSYGTGLGMAIAKKIIEGHHGEIHVKSKEKRGTEFIVALPKA